MSKNAVIARKNFFEYCFQVLKKRIGRVSFWFERSNSEGLFLNLFNFFNCLISILIPNLYCQAPDKILGLPEPIKLWMSWRMTRKQIFKKTSSAKYSFRKSGGAIVPLAPPSSGALIAYLKIESKFAKCIVLKRFVLTKYLNFARRPQLRLHFLFISLHLKFHVSCFSK